jgi:hypothetical protein
VQYWQKTISPNLVNSSFTFLKYLIISGCFSMPIVLLALGHWIWHAVERSCYKSKERNYALDEEKKKEISLDEWNPE